jgi:hypothetical protein
VIVRVIEAAGDVAREIVAQFVDSSQFVVH